MMKELFGRFLGHVIIAWAIFLIGYLCAVFIFQNWNAAEWPMLARAVYIVGALVWTAVFLDDSEPAAIGSDEE